MQFDSLLSIIGSMASIGGVPLAIYLYLRTREAKHTRIRKSITKTLSYQIGEGRELSRFEIERVVASKLREARLKSTSLSVSEVLDQLVSETIANPMLEAARKEKILRNLQQIHASSEREAIIEEYMQSAEKFLAALKARDALKDASITKEIAEVLAETKAAENARELALMKSVGGEPVTKRAPSVIFGTSAALLTVVFLGAVSGAGVVNLALSDEAFLFVSLLDSKIWLGVLASLVSLLAMVFVLRRNSSKK